MSVLVLLLMIPVVTGVIGWITNWAAVKMIFYPARFVGVGPIGWQAIIHRHAGKFATGIADMALENLLTPKEVAESLDPKEMQALVRDRVDAETETLCQKVADVVQPGAWAMLPESVKAMVLGQIQSQSTQIVDDVAAKLRERADEVIDLRTVIEEQLSGQNADKLVRLTRRIGAKEFKFIEVCGLVFGFIIGMAQVAVWTAMQIWWLMPIVGVMVGLLTNYLAIQMIFRPLEPKKYFFGLITYQGLFTKRQAEIARDYGDSSSKDVLTAHNLINVLTRGDTGVRMKQLVVDAISERVDTEWLKYKPMVPMAVTDEQLANVKQEVVDHVLALAVKVRPQLEAYIDKTLDVANVVEQRLGALSKHKFERVLRRIFEEDELTLILVGGVLGGSVGLGQGMLLFAM